MLDKVFLGMPDDPEERKEYLESNADAVEELNYTRTLTQDELDAIKETICETSSEIVRIEAEKKEAMADFNTQIGELNAIRKEKLEKWEHKAEYIKAELTDSAINDVLERIQAAAPHITIMEA